MFVERPRSLEGPSQGVSRRAFQGASQGASRGAPWAASQAACRAASWAASPSTYIALAGRPLRGLIKWVPRVGETPFSEKVHVLRKRKPLFPRPSDLNGGHEGFDNECAQIQRLRTEMNMMKSRGAPAAKTYCHLTRTGSMFFLLVVQCWGRRGGFGARWRVAGLLTQASGP